MKRSRIANSFSIQAIWLHQAGSRAFAEKVEMMALSVVSNEINCSESILVDFDTSMVNTLIIPKLLQHVPIRVITDRTKVSNTRTLPSRRNRKVRSVSTEALQE